MDRLPDAPEGFEPEIGLDDESIPLWVRIQESERMMKLAQRAAKGRGITWAQREAEYYSAKARESFALLEEGYNATLIAQVIKGMPETNAALKERLAEKVGYENAKEAINVYKIITRVLNDEQQREWEQARRTT